VPFTTTCGGESNKIHGSTGSSDHSTIVGGESNLMSWYPYLANAIDHSFIGGGDNNQVYSAEVTIGGGTTNVVDHANQATMVIIILPMVSHQQLAG